MTGRLEGKVAVITGGGNGIGAASARRFGAEGATVLVADLQTTNAAAVAQDVEADGGVASAIHLDAADPESNEAMVAAAVDRYGSVDVLVTAAGVSSGDYISGDLEIARKRVRLAAEARAVNPGAPITELDIDDWRRVLDINLTGTLLAIQSATRVMLDRGTGGSIVTIASIAAVDPLWGTPSYPVSKAGVWMLTKNASRTLAPLGIRVNAIGPGFIETNMTAVIDEVDEMSAAVIGNTPLGRKGTPDEVANVALFLASDEASYVTGELIHPDGGWFTG
jgi:NAD(P)-dependent dehydrogenase (short-subunit alcohol dehydrogenase family)